MANIVDNLLVEGMLRNLCWSPGIVVQPLAAGTLQLTLSSAFQQAFTGTTAGQIVQLPDATTLNEGHRFNIYNTSSSATLVIKDGNGLTLLTLQPGVNTIASLFDNSTVGGSWAFDSSAVVSVGSLISYSAVASASFSVSGSTAQPITSMSVTPVAGTYFVFYDGSIQIVTNNITVTTSLYRGASQITDSIRTITSSVSTFNTTHQTKTIAYFDGTQTCQAYVQKGGGSATITGRSLVLIRLGD